MNTGLANKIVLITGASGGIGRAAAVAFAGEGARLVLQGNSRLDLVEALNEELGGAALVVRADVREEAEVSALFASAMERYGRVDVVVANAGIWPAAEEPVHRMSLERWHDTLATNLTGVFLCAREFFSILEKTRPGTASFIIVGSTAALFGEENHADYAASKAAVTYGLMKSLKNEIVRIVPMGRVNAVCPGWTRTRMTEEELKDLDTVVPTLQTRAHKRIARSEDIARSIVFLASDELAGHVTGEVLTVSGGMEGRLLHQPGDIDPGEA